MTRKSLFILTIVLAVCMAATNMNAKPRMTRIWMFGVGASFTDSVAFITDVQQLDSAYIETSNSFLYDRSLYALQLKNHLEENLGKENPTCAIYFSKKKASLEKKYAKVRKRFRSDESINLKQLNAGTFSFFAEEWVEHESLANGR